MVKLLKLISWVALVSLPQAICAEEITVLKLTDGSTLKGKIVVQRPGKDITIASETASFVVDAANLKSLKSKKVKYEDLPREWKRWAMEKKKLQGDANGRYLVFNEITTKNYVYSDVVKLEHAKTPKVTYEQVVPNTYNIKWSDVATIEHLKSTAKNQPAIDDEVTTTKGKTYQGKIIRQQMGKSLTVKTKSGDVVLNISDIVETRKLAHTAGQKLYEIADYTNTLVLKNESTKNGIILAQHYGKKAKDQYVTLLYENGTKEKIGTNEIAEYRTKYKKQSSEVYKPDFVYVNEFHIKKAKTVTEGNKTYYVDKNVFPFPEGIVTTFKSRGPKLQSSWKLIALENMEMSNGKTTQGYSSETVKSNSITPSTTDLTGNISSISFTYLSPGFYALVNADKSETYIIKIVK